MCGNMGGGGSSGGGGVSSVTTQSGHVIDLSGNPLVYGGKDSSLSDKQRQTIEAFEQKRLNAKIEYGYLVDSNGNEVYTKKGGKGSVSMPSSEYAKSEIMSHNHPRGKGEEATLGGSFSSADTDTFSNTRIKTMRASAYEGTYSITKKSNFNNKEFKEYSRKVHKDRRAELNAARAEINKKYREGKYNSYDDYIKDWGTNSFNRYLVNVHNDYIKGQNQYGYTYTLERR